MCESLPYMDHDELRAVLGHTGDQPLTEEEFRTVVEDLDVNRDGKIDYNGERGWFCRG